MEDRASSVNIFNKADVRRQGMAGRIKTRRRAHVKALGRNRDDAELAVEDDF